jgi:hypothetical protein
MKRLQNAWFVLAIVASCCATGVPDAGGASRGTAFAGDPPEKPKKSVDPADVYYGDATKWEKPAEVDADKVYANIDEYKEIIDKGLKPGDAKYEILMCKASKKFSKAVKKTAKDAGYDLVARKGSVKGVESVPDITSDVVSNL